jgi:glycosyltransferase involved in cell wall biosynthesis
MTNSILIVGQNQGWNLEGSYGRAFEKLGWQIHFWDPGKALSRVARGSRVGRLVSNFINVEPWVRKANLDFLTIAQRVRPTLVLVIGTEGIRAGTLGQLRAQMPSTVLYCLFPDTPHNLVPDRIQALPMFHRVLTVSAAWADSFRRLGAERVDHLPLAADTDLHYPIDGIEANGNRHDVAFIGNWRPEREAFLEALGEFDLCIWGSDYWKRNTMKTSKLPSRWQGRQLVGPEFARACAETRILLNIIDGVGWPGPNMRTFEQPACRAFSLVSRTPAVTDIFEEGNTIECFASVDEARDKINFYLRNDSARTRIAERAYNLVANGGHTYSDRAKQILAWLAEDQA